MPAESAPVEQRRPRGSEFVFARLRYDSGDWDYNPKVAANLLNSIVEYTSIPVFPEEVVIGASADDLLAFPFLFMTGHKLVRFTREERERLRSFVKQGGLLFSDDCNHDVNGLYARSFEQEMGLIFGSAALPKLSNAPCDLPKLLYVRRRPARHVTRAEWVGRRDCARLPPRRAASGANRRSLQQQGLRLRVGLRLAEQALPTRGQHQVRRQHRRLRDDGVNLS